MVYHVVKRWFYCAESCFTVRIEMCMLTVQYMYFPFQLLEPRHAGTLVPWGLGPMDPDDFCDGDSSEHGRNHCFDLRTKSIHKLNCSEKKSPN